VFSIPVAESKVLVKSFLTIVYSSPVTSTRVPLFAPKFLSSVVTDPHQVLVT